MPRKNSIKTYIPGSYYHIYNRGVEKRIIYQDKQDYNVFLSYLRHSLSPQPKFSDFKKTINIELQGLPLQLMQITRVPKSYFEKIELNAYCLMPNHFHLLIKQIDSDSMKSFMISLITRYSMYFNKKYNRVGSLFQGPYKAIMINDENYLLHLSRYIHINPSEYSKDLTKAYSSYPDYIGLRNTPWIKKELILSYFKGPSNKLFRKVNSYIDFVEKYKQDNTSFLGNLTLED